MKVKTVLVFLIGSMLLGLVAPKLGAQTSSYQAQQQNPRPGQPGHQPHEEWAASQPSDLNDFNVIASFAPPQGFLGNLTYDRATGRLFLISLGPPTTKSPSKLFEVNAFTGAVVAEAVMPFKGDFGSPIYIDGFLYQGIFHESRLYKIDVRTRSRFGRIIKTVSLPTLNDLKLVDESYPFPFIEFGGVTVTPDKKLMLHSDDTGEFITVDPETGRLLRRTMTIKALGGITAAPGPDGKLLVLGNSDPRGGYCALSYPPEFSRSPEQKDISWALLDGGTGEVLASIRTPNSRVYASSVSLAGYQKAAGDTYGRYMFFATGEEGILKMQWTPKKGAY